MYMGGKAPPVSTITDCYIHFPFIYTYFMCDASLLFDCYAPKLEMGYTNPKSTITTK